MKKRILKRHKSLKSPLSVILSGIIFTLLVMIPTSAAAVSYHIYGPVTNVYMCPEEGVEESSGTPCEDAIAEPIPVPIVEVWNADTSELIGRTTGNVYGYYHLFYSAPASPAHKIFVRVLQKTEDGEKYIGEIHETSGGNPIEVTGQQFYFPVEIISENLLNFSSTTKFSTSNLFLFTQVGKIAIHHIYDEQADSTVDTSLLGVTKPESSIPAGDFTVRSHSAFGSELWLYGMFGQTDTAFYYRVRYEGKNSSGTVVDTGYIEDDLYKYNYTVSGSTVTVNRVKMGPLTTSEDPMLPASLASSKVYRINEKMVSDLGWTPFWTEVAQRAKWKTGSKNAHYTLYIEAWDIGGTQVYDSKVTSTNDYDTMNLRVVNTAPVCTIHEIQYLDGAAILSGPSTECTTAYLNLTDLDPNDNNLQFLYTAKHTDGFMGYYFFRAKYGHDTPAGPDNGNIIKASYTDTTPPFFLGPDNQTVVTPGAIVYKSCAYRFQLHVYPRITDGYDKHIYEREDNWYVCVKVIE